MIEMTHLTTDALAHRLRIAAREPRSVSAAERSALMEAAASRLETLAYDPEHMPEPEPTIADRCHDPADAARWDAWAEQNSRVVNAAWGIPTAEPAPGAIEWASADDMLADVLNVARALGRCDNGYRSGRGTLRCELVNGHDGHHQYGDDGGDYHWLSTDVGAVVIVPEP